MGEKCHDVNAALTAKEPLRHTGLKLATYTKGRVTKHLWVSEAAKEKFERDGIIPRIKQAGEEEVEEDSLVDEIDSTSPGEVLTLKLPAVTIITPF